MKKSHLHLLFVVFLIQSCASQLPPTGGPKDEDPPQLIIALPENNTLNFKGQVVELTFDENIQVKNLKTELLITPTYTGEYDFKQQRESVIIEFEEPFADSTTYTLNFRESIVDLNEGNPAENLRIAFSTWDFLDSMEIHGKIINLLTDIPAADYTIGIYDDADTLNPLNAIPLYITKTREDGSYSFYNIKSDQYRIYAYEDKNNNLLIDYKNESYGFLKDSIQLDTTKTDVDFIATNLDLTDLEVSGTRQNGHHYEIKISKYATSYNLSFLDTANTDTLYHQLIDKHRTVKVYNTLHDTDSTGLIISAMDSLYTTITDTVYIHFIPSSRKKEEFKVTASSYLEDSTMYSTLTFSKPIRSFQPDSIMIEYDTANIFPIDTTVLITKKDFEISLQKDLTNDSLFYSEIIINRSKKTLNDSLNKSKIVRRGEVLLIDSMNNSEINIPQDTLLDFSFVKPVKIKRKPKIVFNKASFISIEGDTSTYQSQALTEKKLNQFGSIRGDVNLPYDSYILQLIDQNNAVVDTLVNTKSYLFQQLNPGTYRIRVLIDENNNGKWDPGNIFLNQPPEPVIFYQNENNQQEIKLRANWEIVDINIEIPIEL